VVCALAFVAIVIVANRDCAPKYFQRGDVLALLSLTVLFAAALTWAGAGETDDRRGVGSLASVGLAAVFLSTASFPMLVAPIAVVGALRLPRGRAVRWGAAAALPVVVLAVWALVLVAQSTVAPAQFICP